MPYTIGKKGSKFVVRKKHGGKVMGTHSSKKKAKAQQAAIYANESISMVGDEWKANIAPLDLVVNQIRQWSRRTISAQEALRNIRRMYNAGQLRVRRGLGYLDVMETLTKIVHDVFWDQCNKQLDAEETMVILRDRLYGHYELNESLSITGDEWQSQGYITRPARGAAPDIVRNWVAGEIESEQAAVALASTDLDAIAMFGPFGFTTCPRAKSLVWAWEENRLNSDDLMVTLKGLFYIE